MCLELLTFVPQRLPLTMRRLQRLLQAFALALRAPHSLRVHWRFACALLLLLASASRQTPRLRCTSHSLLIACLPALSPCASAWRGCILWPRVDVIHFVPCCLLNSCLELSTNIGYLGCESEWHHDNGLHRSIWSINWLASVQPQQPMLGDEKACKMKNATQCNTTPSACASTSQPEDAIATARQTGSRLQSGQGGSGCSDDRGRISMGGQRCIDASMKGQRQATQGSPTAATVG